MPINPTAEATGTAPARSRLLLQSITDVALAIFGAGASSIFLYDRPAGELVFEAVSGQGEDFLVGTRMPADAGIAGWVVTSGEPLAVDDLTASPVFARDLATSTRYVPESMMAAPLLVEDAVLGVLEVLDPVPQSRASLSELDLLSLFARQAAVAVLVTAEHERTCRAAPVAAGLGAEQQLGLVEAFRDFLDGMARR